MNRQKGFTLIELLIVVAIVGILAAIAVPNLLNALDRGKQKRTMMDLRTIGVAVETYQVDNSHYPVAVDAAALAVVLEPDYIKRLPEHDGWGNPFIVTSTNLSMTVLSKGKDAAGDANCDISGGIIHSVKDAICWVDGRFTQYPEGGQTTQ